jgi:MFS family permease
MSNFESNPYDAPLASSQPTEKTSVVAAPTDGAPPLAMNRSFIGLSITQFLGAFNDNLYKQIILLLAVPLAITAQETAGDSKQADDVQGWATLIFALPFVLFSGYAGFLSDKYSKRTVIVLAKFAEIVVMAMGALAFLAYDQLGMAGTWTVLFLMATHSAFFGPGKYGILPELFPKRQLANANGVILMTTFLAIILGTLAAGAIFDMLSTEGKNGYAQAQPLWRGSVACMLIAIVGVMTSLLIRKTPPAQPNAVLTPDALAVDRNVAATLFKDGPLLRALLVSCVFWLISGICVPVINRVGQLLEVTKFQTSILVAAIALGIMLGSIIAIVRQSTQSTNARQQVFIGLWGMTLALGLLSIWNKELPMFGFWTIFAILLILGIFVATYAIPLQVFLQDRPPDALKGRMIATMNQANFIGILLSGPLYQLFQSFAGWIEIPINSVFGMMAIMLLPIAMLYRLSDSAKPTEMNQS